MLLGLLFFVESCFSHVKAWCAKVSFCAAFSFCLSSADNDEEEPIPENSESCGLFSMVSVPLKRI
eukprot:UN12627